MTYEVTCLNGGGIDLWYKLADCEVAPVEKTFSCAALMSVGHRLGEKCVQRRLHVDVAFDGYMQYSCKRYSGQSCFEVLRETKPCAAPSAFNVELSYTLPRLCFGLVDAEHRHQSCDFSSYSHARYLLSFHDCELLHSRAPRLCSVCGVPFHLSSPLRAQTQPGYIFVNNGESYEHI